MLSKLASNKQQANQTFPKLLIMKRNGDHDNSEPKRHKTESFDKESLQRKITEAKAKLNTKLLASVSEDKTKGGLNVAFHPALLQSNLVKQSKKVSENPYELVRFDDPSKTSIYDQNLKSLSSFQPKPRKNRDFKFVEPGSISSVAEQIRRQEKMEKLKLDIAETARKSGLERELELVGNATLRNTLPPNIEWWDQAFVDGSYDKPNENVDVLITNLIHHPIPIEPPGSDVAPKPLPLTKEERKKLKRQQNAIKLQEKQDKQRAGFLPPDQPRVSKTNFVRVLGEESFLNPTAAYSMMQKQVTDRQLAHEARNEASKLTEEERKAKKDRKIRDHTGVIKVAVFKISELNHKPHLFKVNANAHQQKLTGIGIMNSELNLVIVEGGPKCINAYKKLMLRRINWNDKPTGFVEKPDSLPNQCLLIWEGEVNTRSFGSFRLREMPNLLEIKKFLDENNASQYWNISRNFTVEGY